jgi:predicted GNAT family N-acyltransferase
MIQIKSFTSADQALYNKALEIRRQVFIEELNVDPTLEIENEEFCRFYLILIDDKPAGTARWRETEKGIKLERFALLPEFRNQGTGTILLQRILDDVTTFNKKIYLHSQLNAVRYYERQGFVKSGDIFTEALIQHYLMIFQK